MADENIITKRIEEIEELSNIPEVEEFFSQTLIKAKEIFKDKIGQYKQDKAQSEKTRPSFQNGLAKNKSYFFELRRIGKSSKESNYEWILGKFKLQSRKDLVQMIFSPEFIQEIEKAEIKPYPQKTAFQSADGKKFFEIDFRKTNDSRVVGFVKEIGKVEDEAILWESSSGFRLQTNYQNIGKDEMYQKIKQLMEDDPEVRDDIFFYIMMMGKAKASTMEPAAKEPGSASQVEQ